MVIQKGYWNYYMAFQLSSAQNVDTCIERGQFSKYGLTLFSDEEVSIRLQSDDEDPVLTAYADEYEDIARGTEEAINNVYFRSETSDNRIFLMQPLALHYRGKDLLCPIFLYVASNGLCLVKLRVPLLDVNAEEFMTSPQYDLYEGFSTYEDSKERQNNKESDENTNNFRELLYTIIQTTFEGFLLSGYKHLCFETFLIMDSENPDIKKTKRNKDYIDLYHLAYPNAYLEEPNTQKINTFIQENITDIAGFKFIKCFQSRTIILGNVEKLKALYRREDEVDDLEYFENSMQMTFDWAIGIAIWKMLNQLTFLDITTADIHEFTDFKIRYNLVENDLDAMMDLTNDTIINVYRLVYENLNAFAIPLSERLERVRQTEELLKDNYNRRRDLVLEAVAFIVTVIFGLPGIRETICLVRNTLFDSSTELSECISVNGAALIAWLVLIAISGALLIGNWLKHRRVRIRYK